MLLSCLVDLLKPRVEVDVACLVEKRDGFRETVWHAPHVSVSEIEHVRTYAYSHLQDLGLALPLHEDKESGCLRHEPVITLPLFVHPDSLFGGLCLKYRGLDESRVTLLHALGNHIALALDHQYQMQEQKIASERLQRLELEVEGIRQFRRLAECLPQMVWTVQNHDQVTYANQRLVQYLGQDPVLMSQKQGMDLCHPEDRQSLLNAWKKAHSELTTFEAEHRIRRADGAYRWHIVRAVPQFDQNGQLTDWVGTCTDIHEKRQAQEESESANRRLRLFSEIASEILQPHSSTAMIERAVKKLATQLPFDMFLHLLVNAEGTALKLKVHGGIAGEDLEDVKELALDASAEQQVTKLFGRLGRQSSIGLPLRSQKGLIGNLFLGCRHSLAFDDLTFLRTACDQIALALERTLHEEAKEEAVRALEKAKIEADSANQAKSLFLANMSHEIRTPIGVIMGFADLASSLDYPEQERIAALQKIKRNGEELAQLVDDILDLTKVETGHLEIEKVPVDLEDHLQQVMSLLRFKADNKGISLSMDTDRDIPYRMITDPLRLRQCLINVIGNAIKFTEQGRVHVRVSAVRDAQNRRFLKFIVEDTGIGLTPEQQARLFNNFSQANPATSRKYGGSGLGLALSRNLARALDGDLCLEQSIPGKGSTFVLTVAIQEIPRARPQNLRARRSLPPHTSTLDGVRVLVVEDSPDNQMLIRRYLEMAGAEVAIASDGREGVTKALEGSHDLVLMDIQMPYVDGYQATSSLRESGYKKPVIALTANAMRGDKERSMEAGFTDHLSKPIHPGALLNAISSAVRSPLS
ncbi:MAG TPA: response regulator [Oligoflexus sp.]|uniref:response regulator n=1 Tax=Oligoflexus sp. TaxID=1971216 RepID=UPI002D80B170|nr:response regulator [Oligoflexus sp.]HET9239370.1 response regulator [Oligoflexus sp.]